VWNTIIAAVATAALVLYLLRRLRRERDRRRRDYERFFDRAMDVLAGARLEDTGAIGYPRLAGRYRGLPVQVLPVVDTLPIRRLPALWLLVTLQDALPVNARFDLMMRPAGATTFSNFDLLPFTIGRPAGFPEHAIVKTDDPEKLLPADVVAPHLDVFRDSRAKELLVTPNGVRLVWLLAEADRVRYGVFRQADFGGAGLEPELLGSLLDRLVAIRQSILGRPEADA
jgi:hypothetical protein